MGNYFRTIYRIIKFIDEYVDSYKQIDKRFYINLVRAQLSSSELALIFINGISPNGKKFKILIEEYEFLEHLPSLKRYKNFDSTIIEKYNIKSFENGRLSKKSHQIYIFNSKGKDNKTEERNE